MTTRRKRLSAATAYQDRYSNRKRIHATEPKTHMTLCGQMTHITFAKTYPKLREMRTEVNNEGYTFCRECIPKAKTLMSILTMEAENGK